MNALVKKEIRLLLPGWAAIFSLALVIPWFSTDGGTSFGGSAFLIFFGTIIMAVGSFGREFALGTFPLLLSQPIERQRIWRTKIAVLFLAGFLIFLGYFASCESLPRPTLPAQGWGLASQIIKSDFNHAMVGGFVGVLVALVGGLWTALLLRQISAAFWIAFFAPGMILLLIVFCLPATMPVNQNPALALLYGVGALYAAVGFWLARRLFFQAQDAGWSGGAISFSNWRYFESGVESSVSTRHRKPFRALLKKEFQLQSISFFCAAALLVLHLLVVVMRKVHGRFENESVPGAISEFFWFLWPVMPLVLSTTAVAEERKLGVVESQFCLPVSRRTQFTLKFFLVVILGVILGGVMPFLVEGLAALIGAPNPGIDIANRVEFPIFVAVWAMGLALVAFLASTLARNFLQAMGTAVAILIGCVFCGSLAGKLRSIFGIALNPLVTDAMAILTALALVLWLPYGNFKYFEENRRVWRRNLSALVGGFFFILISSALIYDRVWEVFEPAEPPHGPAIFTLAHPPILPTAIFREISVRLPDGRAGFDWLQFQNETAADLSLKSRWRFLTDPLPQSTWPFQFLAGSNWVSVSTREGFVAGIQGNGSLWISSATNRLNLIRHDNETNWAASIPSGEGVLLLKKDGTLWQWRERRFTNGSRQTWRPSYSDQIRQIGTNTWKELYSGFGRNLARKSDGTVWSFYGGDFEFSRQPLLDDVPLAALSLRVSSTIDHAYVRPDGTLWLMHQFRSSLDSKNFKLLGDSSFRKMGSESNWTAVAVTYQKMVALKQDGSLWQWSLQSEKSRSAAPTRLGIHSDWVAISTAGFSVVALAADGGLWFWTDRLEYEPYALMKLPKQPDFLNNILQPSLSNR